MGFYGNISGSNKSAFVFDKVYQNRAAMDDALRADESSNQQMGDGVFLGRFVLVEYDESPISMWVNTSASIPYSADYQYKTPITPILNAVYKDENSYANRSARGETNLAISDFYKCTRVVEGTGTFVRMAETETPYAYNYLIDVTRYGRGYDGTVWRKTFNTNAKKYQYVMLAELNAAVPTFHVDVVGPSESIATPSVDTQDSTNLNYYIHMQTPYVNRFKVVDSSDTTLTQYFDTWTYDADGTEHLVREPQTNAVAINYNALGFEPTVHQTTLDTTNSITRTEASSGRHYSVDILGNYIDDVSDTYEWAVNLPAIGNAVHQLYDIIYGFEGGTRHTVNWLKTSLTDIKEYNDTTLVGAINRAKDVLGYSFSYVGSAPAKDKPAADDKLYFVGTNGRVNNIYYYAKTPVFTQSNSGIYYNDNGTYRVANTDTTIIPPSARYTISSYKYVRTELTPPAQGLAGLLVALHRALGTGVTNARDLNTVAGMIGRIDDVLRNISTSLAKNRLMATTNDGVIATSNTAFPYTTVNSTNGDDYLLDGGGTWRLPQSYELTGLTLDFVEANGYHGNSCLHGVTSTDTLGQAIAKMQEEMADLQYEPQAINSFSVSTPVLSNNGTNSAAGTLLEHGASSAQVTISYSLNKGPRKSIQISRTNPSGTSYSKTSIDPDYYVTNRAAYLATASNTLTETITLGTSAPKWTLHVVDERNYNPADKTASLTFAWRAYWGVSTAHTANEFSTASAIVNLLTKNYGDKLATNSKPSPATMSPGANEYMYYICPNSANPVFKVGGFEGGFDKLGTVAFTNAVGGTNTYAVWRSTKANLGATTVTVS